MVQPVASSMSAWYGLRAYATMGASYIGFLWTYRMEVLAVCISLAAIEVVMLHRSFAGGWSIRDMLSNVITLFVGQGARKLTFLLRFAVLAFLFECSPL